MTMKQLLLILLFLSPSVFGSPVNINSADAKTIADALSGVGLKKAEAIVAYRNEKGPFKAPEDLLNVKGIGAKTVAHNKADILLSESTKK
jgi:competence protein ComEA